MSASTDALAGTLILVVEDEYFLADYLETAITTAGGVVLGPFPSADAALDALGNDERRAHAAVLNVRLQDHDSFPVADELARIGVPFVFASATDRMDMPARFVKRPLLTKPFAAFQVIEALAALLAKSGGPADGRSRAGVLHP